MKKKINYPSERKPATKRICYICGKEFAARGLKTHIKLEHQVEEIVKEVAASPPYNTDENSKPLNTSFERDFRHKVLFQIGFPSPQMVGSKTVAILEHEGGKYKIRRVNRNDLEELDAVISDLKVLREEYLLHIQRHTDMPQMRVIEAQGTAFFKELMAHAMDKDQINAGMAK